MVICFLTLLCTFWIVLLTLFREGYFHTHIPGGVGVGGGGAPLPLSKIPKKHPFELKLSSYVEHSLNFYV